MACAETTSATRLKLILNQQRHLFRSRWRTRTWTQADVSVRCGPSHTMCGTTARLVLWFRSKVSHAMSDRLRALPGPAPKHATSILCPLCRHCKLELLRVVPLGQAVDLEVLSILRAAVVSAKMNFVMAQKISNQRCCTPHGVGFDSHVETAGPDGLAVTADLEDRDLRRSFHHHPLLLRGQVLELPQLRGLRNVACSRPIVVCIHSLRGSAAKLLDVVHGSPCHPHSLPKNPNDGHHNGDHQWNNRPANRPYVVGQDAQPNHNAQLGKSTATILHVAPDRSKKSPACQAYQAIANGPEPCVPCGPTPAVDGVPHVLSWCLHVLQVVDGSRRPFTGPSPPRAVRWRSAGIGRPPPSWRSRAEQHQRHKPGHGSRPAPEPMGSVLSPNQLQPCFCSLKVTLSAKFQNKYM